VKTVPVSRRALIQRINHKLAHENKVLRATRRRVDHAILGDYYIVDTHFNAVTATHCDPAKLAKELGVLADYESIQEQ
jgi:hypothetical protein